jgi:hypothetical protein
MSAGNCRLPSAVKDDFSPQTHADERRQKMMGKKRTENLLLLGRTRRPDIDGVRRRLNIFFTADTRGLTQTIEKRFKAQGKKFSVYRRLAGTFQHHSFPASWPQATVLPACLTIDLKPSAEQRQNQ